MVDVAQNKGEKSISLRVEANPICARAVISSVVTGRRIGGGYFS